MPSGNLILSLNSGSSSLKITLYSRRDLRTQHLGSDARVDLVLNASISNITAPPAKFKFKIEQSGSVSSGAEKEESVEAIKDHATAFAHFLRRLEKDASIQPEQIAYICHRVVHGGNYSKPVVIDKESYEEIEHLSDLAPL
jgi:acetate kinase